MALSPQVERWRPLVSKYFRPEDVEAALAVMEEESHGDPGLPSQFNAQGTEDSWGLFQVNIDAHGQTPEYWSDPETNVAKAAELRYGAGNWRDWEHTANKLGLPTEGSGGGQAVAETGDALDDIIKKATGDKTGSSPDIEWVDLGDGRKVPMQWDGSQWIPAPGMAQYGPQAPGSAGGKRETQIFNRSDGAQLLIDKETGEVIRVLSGPGSATAAKPSVEQMKYEAQARRDALWQKVAAGEMRPEEAVRDFSEWYKVNVELPMTKSQLAIDTRDALMKNAAGDGYSEDMSRALATLSSGGGEVSFRPEGFRIDPAQIDQMASDSLSRMLGAFSPAAAGAGGRQMGPLPGSVDVAAARVPYAPGVGMGEVQRFGQYNRPRVGVGMGEVQRYGQAPVTPVPGIGEMMLGEGYGVQGLPVYRGPVLAGGVRPRAM